jgi:hypothetical protein
MIVDRAALVEQIVRARARNQHDLAAQLEVQYVEACIFVAPEEPKERDLRAIPDRERNSEERFHFPPPYDEQPRERAIDGLFSDPRRGGVR